MELQEKDTIKIYSTTKSGEEMIILHWLYQFCRKIVRIYVENYRNFFV